MTLIIRIALTSMTFASVTIAPAVSRAGSERVEPNSENHRLDYAEFQVLRPDGSEQWHYTSFMVYDTDGKTNSVEAFLDSDDPGAMSARTLMMKSRMLADKKTSIAEGMSMDVAAEGYSRTEDLPGGRKKILMEKNFANWWTNKGESIIEKDGSMSSRMEMRNKAGELVSTYLMKSHPATKAERELFEKRKNAAKAAAPKTEAIIDYSQKRSRASYPENPSGSAR